MEYTIAILIGILLFFNIFRARSFFRKLLSLLALIFLLWIYRLELLTFFDSAEHFPRIGSALMQFRYFLTNIFQRLITWVSSVF